MPATTRIDNPMDLHAACEPWMGHSSQVSVPWAGAVTGRVAALLVSLDGYMEPAEDAGAADAFAMRLHLLSRAHELIEFLAGSGWVLEHAPVMDFRGQLAHGTWTVAGEMVEPPREYGIGLSVGLELISQ